MQNFCHTIWMGDLEAYMDEALIKKLFEVHDEHPYSVKIIRNKATGQTLGYGFIEFLDANSARDAMLKLNGKPIPGLPNKRFKLNHASYGKDNPNGGDYSLFVGELTEDVDDMTLYNAFKKYPTCRSAKIVTNEGKSKGYGFVRFMAEVDMDRALIEMQNYCGLGSKPIRVSLAIPKRYTADSNVMMQSMKEQQESSSILPSGVPDPFSAAVAAAVSGSSAAQAEYYQTYQQYCQQYYAAHYAHSTNIQSGMENNEQDIQACQSNAMASMLMASLDAMANSKKQQQEQIIRDAQEANAPTIKEVQPPEPMLTAQAMSSTYDKPRHIEDFGECFEFIESSRWDFMEPNLHLVFNVLPVV